MIRLQRSRKIKRHKKAEALQYAKEVALLANRIDDSAQFKVFVGMLGSVETIFWIGEFEGMASLEISLQKIESDPRWREVHEKFPRDIFVEGTARESVMEQVS